ncbi:MAG TPA: hypothetical protein DCR11_10375 [Deltaproteobacteria bacterium]|nr:hypothetical protein [Deltaproteobacteria bacterium]
MPGGPRSPAFKMSKRNHILNAVAIAVIFIAGACIRLIPWDNFVTSTGIYFLEADNYEHFRKVRVLLEQFPSIPDHDFYMGFPIGTGNIWAPLTDFSFAVIIKLLSLLPSINGDIAYILAVLPPFVGTLAVIPLYLWCKETFGCKAALIASIIFILLPAHIFTTVVGRPDNELFEPIWAGITFCLYALSASEAEKGEPSGKRLVVLSALAGLSAAVSLLYWRGAVIWWSILGLYSVAMVFGYSFKDGKRWVGFFISGAVAFFTMAFVIAFVLVFNPFSLKGGTEFNVVSWFHVITALLAVASLGALALAVYLKKERSAGLGKAAVAGIALLSAVIIIFAFVAPSFFKGITEGLGVVGGGNKWTSTIAQYKPLLFANGRFGIKEPLVFSTIFLFISPIALFSLSRQWRRASAASLFFVFAGWTLLAVTLINGRYENVYTLIVAGAGGVFLSSVGGLIEARVDGAKGRAAGTSAIVALVIVGLLPSVSFYKGLPHTGPFLIQGDLEDTLFWIRDNTSATSNYLYPQEKPEYGVLAQWEFGGWIEAMAKRPSVATVMGTETHGMKESAGFYLATDEREFLKIIDDNGVKYFILSKTLADLPEYAAIIGEDPTGYVNRKVLPDGSETIETGQRFFDLLTTSLYLNDGQRAASPIPFRSVPGVRLVYESNGQSDFKGLPQEVKKYKVFERVKGAIVKGAARPGEPVAMAGLVMTNTGRKFFVTGDTSADSEGVFYLSFFYPNVDMRAGKTGIVSGYVVQVGKKKYDLQVSEKDILEGNVILFGK